MKCTRCGHKMGKTKDGWKNCPNCGIAKYVGEKVAKEKVKENAEKEE